MQSNRDFNNLSEKLVAVVSAGQDASPFRAEINSMSPKERLQFVHSLNRTVSKDSYNRALNDTTNGALILDVRCAKDGTVADIDLLRRAKSNEKKNVLTRIDLFDSANAAGKEADEKQRLDAITKPYELLFNFAETKLVIAQVDNFEQARNSAMRSIVYRINDDVADPAKAKKIVANFLNNLKNVGEQNGYSTSTKHSKAMFVGSALDGTSEKVVPVDLQRDIDKLYYELYPANLPKRAVR